jgi:sugar fermentation stimulation protein A
MELMEMRRQGARAAMLFLAQRHDRRRFAVAGDIDPVYAAALAEASAAGVEILAYACCLSSSEIELAEPIALPPALASPPAAKPRLLQNRSPGPLFRP